MSKLQIIEVPIEDLIPYVNNARTHSEEQVAQIAASIREFGWTNPILIDGENGIIAGHGRLAAARKLKMDAIPAIQLDGLSETQKKALILADNKLALNSGWDDDLLRLEIESLQEENFNIELIGFNVAELELLTFKEKDNYPESSSKEIDPDNYKMGHQCPKCGFEFDEK